MNVSTKSPLASGLSLSLVVLGITLQTKDRSTANVVCQIEPSASSELTGTGMQVCFQAPVEYVQGMEIGQTHDVSLLILPSPVSSDTPVSNPVEETPVDADKSAVIQQGGVEVGAVGKLATDEPDDAEITAVSVPAQEPEHIVPDTPIS